MGLLIFSCLGDGVDSAIDFSYSLLKIFEYLQQEALCYSFENAE